MMRTFIVISLLLFIGLLVMLASEPACGQTFPYGREALTEPDNAHYVGKGGDFRSIGAAVAGASTGDVIYIWPGTYTEDITISTQVYLVSIGKHAATLIGTITLGVDNVEVHGMKLEPTGSSNPVTGGAYSYLLRDCIVDCDSWDVGNDTVYSYHCEFTMSADSGWSISGDGAIWHIEDSRFGIDIPIEASAKAGVHVDSGATLVLWDVEAYSDDGAESTPMFYTNVNHGDSTKNKIFFNQCRVVCDNGPVLCMSDTGAVSVEHSYLETGDADSAVVHLADSTWMSANHSRFNDVGSDTAIHTNTRGTSHLKNMLLEGLLWLDDEGTAGTTNGVMNIYGSVNFKVDGSTVIVDDSSKAAWLYGMGRIFVPTGQDFRPPSDGGGDIGTEGTEFDSVFAKNVHVDSVEVREYIGPDADNGAKIGTRGTSIDSIFCDDLVVDATIEVPANTISDEELDESAAFDWTGDHTWADSVTLGASGTKFGNMAVGISQYTGTEQVDTVLMSGLPSGAGNSFTVWGFNPGGAAVNANDAIMSVYPGTNGDTLFAIRAASGTSGLIWSYITIW
jgi:hypothetical protein